MRDADGGIPRFIYGTAWKEDETETLTYLALEHGFRGIDTANQRIHYVESGVGAAVKRFMADTGISREELFLQTKFTFRDGQDHRLPYDPEAPVAEQVRQSFRSSLDHLGTDYLDAYVLHGPSSHLGLWDDDWDAWHAMEAICDAGGTRVLGVSNISAEQLAVLCEGASILPQFVQNRCYAISGWDAEVRSFCRDLGIMYQGFSLLTANRQVVNSMEIADLAARYERSPQEIIFRFAQQAGMIPLTGTRSPEHMIGDLAVETFTLAEDHVTLIETLAVQD